MAMTFPGAKMLNPGAGRPSVTIWSRLEVDPSTTDPGPALAAAFADPLWTLTRQWQFGEFDGEDAGSPVQADIAVEWAPLAAFCAGSADSAFHSISPGVPLEALAGAEPAGPVPFVERARAGHLFLQMLRAADLPDGFSGLGAFALEPLGEVALASDRDAREWVALMPGDVVDGEKLAIAIAAANGVPEGVAVVPAQREELGELCREWLDGYRGSLTTAPPPSWASEHLEARFAVSAPGAGLFECREYKGGRLDWYDFDPLPDKRAGGSAGKPARLTPPPVLPTPVRFTGMPADRFWEFEDARLNLAAIGAGPLDLARLVLVEFALVFGNDWFAIPLTLPTGSLSRLARLSVRDSFGGETIVPALADPSWRMFTPGASSDDLVPILPAAEGMLEGDAIEELALIRDEMANLAWAIERKVTGSSGGGLDRGAEPVRPDAERPPLATAATTTATGRLDYRLRSEVPAHWIPLVAIAPGPATDRQLELRAIRRHTADGGIEAVEPRGQLLRTDPARPPADEVPFRLCDAELTADGITLRRLHRIARTPDGRRIAWNARRKLDGASEPASGLGFDLATPAADD